MSHLVGMPMTDCWAAADMAILEFGQQRQSMNRRGERILRGDVTLHVQSPWWLGCGPEEALSYADLTKGNQRWQAWRMKLDASPLLVRTLDLDETGDMRLSFNDGYELELRGDSSEADTDELEYWRVIGLLTGGGHLFVSNRGWFESRDDALPS